MKTFALLFGIAALMLHISLSSLSGIKKCRKQLATSSYIAISNNQNTKDQTSNTDKSTDRTCNISAPVTAFEQNKELPLITNPAKEFSTLSNPQYTQQYIDPPFAPPR